MVDVPELTSLDLIDPLRKEKKILLPNEIPIYPSILKEDFAYSSDFTEEVLTLVPDIVTKDLETIENKLGAKLKIKATLEGIFKTDTHFGDVRYDRVVCRPILCAKTNEIEFISTQIYINPKPPLIFFEDGHPLPMDKAKTYAISNKNEEIILYGWGTHNINSCYLPFQILSRNFAIAFNNLGLKKLQKGD